MTEAVETELDEREELFRKAIFSLLRDAVFAKTPKQADAIAEVIALTGRSRSSVVNWLVNGSYVPDLVAFFKLAAHYNVDLTGAPMLEALQRLSPEAPPIPREHMPVGSYMLKALDTGNPVKKALRRYTANPDSTLFMMYAGDDMADHISRDELILVDVSIEAIQSDGIYLLQAGERTFLRVAQLRLASQAITLSALNPNYAHLAETVTPDAEGIIPGVQVHGRVVGVLKP